MRGLNHFIERKADYLKAVVSLEQACLQKESSFLRQHVKAKGLALVLALAREAAAWS